ncbi:FimV/HubP family polar landmark protein [Nitrosospira sp. Is2]|uniref:FimV/HubP family polar landmark protein n=1 Tax=Nitrosospira sp. Is2 TaxID=3080532 RepID=UPI002953E9AB|nr:FimV/HubP family polar landmark protein [Nitrosospira sp. Is2]WON74424.1 FimV/HubP family polar landmark protein [Nitrosospira sp. Is2]
MSPADKRAALLLDGYAATGRARPAPQEHADFSGNALHGEFVQRVVTVSVLLIALMASGAAPAAGLGRLTQTSAIGQPFQAEIELVAVRNEERRVLTASLPSQQFFRHANVEYLPLLAMFQASIETRSDGQPYVRIASSQPVAEPLLNLLVELNWPSGRVVREYTVVLAPPAGYALTHSKQLVETSPSVSAEAELPSRNADGMGTWERFRFSVAKADTEEEALKQTVTGKIESAQTADPVSSREKEGPRVLRKLSEGMESQHTGSEADLEVDVSGSIRVNGRDESAQANLHAIEEDATARKGSLRQADESVALPVPQSAQSAPSAPIQTDTIHTVEATSVYEAADESVSVARPIKVPLLSAGASDPEAGSLVHTQGKRSVVDQLTMNLEFLGGALVLLFTGIVGVSIARRPREAGAHAGENVVAPAPDSPAGGGALPVIINPQTDAALPVEAMGAAVETQMYQETPDAQAEPIPRISRNAAAKATEHQQSPGMKIRSPFYGPSGDAPPPSGPGSLMERRLAGIDLNKDRRSTDVARGPLLERGMRWREILSQLDLARAYQEMGDKDAALQVLREVIRDGDSAQRESARRILANL